MKHIFALILIIVTVVSGHIFIECIVKSFELWHYSREYFESLACAVPAAFFAALAGCCISLIFAIIRSNSQ